MITLGKENNEIRKINTLKCLNIVMKNQDIEFFHNFFVSALDLQAFLKVVATCSLSQDISVKK